MQKFILLRGHQGSGKSTYAAELIVQFKNEHPNAQIVHIENDKELTNANGEYQWSSEALAAAQEKGRAMMRNALKRGQQSPQQALLIINSNTNQKATNCIQMLQSARNHGFQTEVYRLHNFYPNHHNVAQDGVLAAYIKLNQNPLRDEIHVPAVQAMSPEQHAQIQEMTQFKNRAPQYDPARHTHITEDYLRLGQRDFSIKPSKKYPQLSVLKYARSVFYENRFDNALLEMRGIVLDPHNQIIIRPFNKVFNYSERIAANSRYPIHIADDHRLTAVVKVNGFLGCCTYVRLPENHPSHGADFDNQILYSTTGSLDSDFAKLVQRHCAQYQAL
ncbi:MAG: AAA family ATPase, partial [Kingella oralis]